MWAPVEGPPGQLGHTRGGHIVLDVSALKQEKSFPNASISIQVSSTH